MIDYVSKSFGKSTRKLLLFHHYLKIFLLLVLVTVEQFEWKRNWILFEHRFYDAFPKILLKRDNNVTGQ